MQKFELTITAEIRQTEPYASGSNLMIRESISVEASGFLDLCKVLAQFHDLSESLRPKGQK